MSQPRSELTQAYAEYGPLVRAYALGRLGDLHEADEVLQETFFAVARNTTEFSRSHSRKAWLIGIARNVIRNRLRAQKVRRTVPLDPDVAAAAKHSEDDRLDEMRRAIARLPEALRETLDLRLAHDLSYEEIAAALQIPIGTVRSRIHNAVVALRDWAERTVDASSFAAKR
ncbi:MAG: RNA polymerase sigma factor [Planctomycetes bacterium]|nr:RNA polymerase sigma factor [Planctomycetota bacterium]